MLHGSDSGWTNPKVVTLLVVVFLCGAAAGSAITSGYLHSRMPGKRASMEAAQRIGVQQLRTELSLTADQEQTIMKVLDDYGKYYQNIEDEREDVAEHGKQRILSILDDRQKHRFLEILKNPGLLSNAGLQ